MYRCSQRTTALPLLAILLSAASPASAQAYRWASTCASPSSPLTTTPITFASENSVFPVAIGFSFPWFGNSYSNLYLSSNGWLSFTNPGFNSAPTSQPIPSAAVPNNLIAFYWTDLVPAVGATRSSTTASGALQIEVRATEKAGGATVELVVELHPAGNIRILYRTVGSLGGVAVGIEDDAGSQGLELWQQGPVAGGLARLESGTGVQLFPSSRLGSSPLTSCGTSSSQAAGPENLLSAYPWIPTSFAGFESSVSVELSEPSSLTAVLSGFVPRSLSLWILPENPGLDLEPAAGPSTTVTLPVADLGPYTLLVDGVQESDLGPTSGSFTLTTTCTPIPTLDCGGSVAGVTTGSNRVDRWNCAGAITDLGPEAYYRVTVPDGGTLDLSVVSAADLDLAVFDAAGFRLGCSDCRAWGNGSVSAALLAPGDTVLVAVDGRLATDSGAFQLNAQCSRNLDCAGATTLDLSQSGTIAGTTTGGPAVGSDYTCAFDRDGRPGPASVAGLTGPERIYRFTVPDEMVASFRFESSNPDLVPLILSGCNEGLCHAPVSCGEGLPAGSYWLVIDGRNGASGAFTLTPLLLPATPYQRWYDCPECCDAQCLQFLDPPSWSERTNWRFSSSNNCGTGCDFSLFAVVDCGSELHLPIHDAESFRVRAFDVLRSRFVSLTATNDLPLNPPTVERFTVTGTEVSWQDRSCSPAPPCPSANCGGTPSCGGGTDAATNSAIVDIGLSDPESACGVYRFDFIGMGGSVWDLYNNCSSDRSESFPVYRDLCAAMEAWRPLPQLTLENVSAHSSLCPAPEISFRVRNVGCGSAGAFKVLLSSSGGEPDVEVSFAGLAAFASSTQRVAFPVTGSSRTLTLTVDGVPAGGALSECTDATGTRGCGTPVVVRSSSVGVCAPCTVQAAAGANASICEGDPAPLDGSGSLLDTCATRLLYRWEEVGNPGNFRDFLPDPTWTGQTPVVDTTYRLRVACEGSATCEDEDEVDVFVTLPQRPDRVANTLLGTRAASDIDWRWQPPAGGAPPDRYRLYRDTARDVAVASRTQVLETLAPIVQALDLGGVGAPGSPLYHQVVAASCGSAPLEGPY